MQLIDCDTGTVFFDKLTFLYIELKKFTKEFNEAKTFFEQWIYIIKHLHELNDIPEKLRNDEVFVRLFEIAKIARMTQTEVNNYLKDLNNMNIVRNEIRTLKNFISERDNVIIQHVNTITQQNARIAELERLVALNKRSQVVE